MNAVVKADLSPKDKTFALAVIEYGGNLGAAYVAAYGETAHAAAKAREVLCRPEIAAYVQRLNAAVEENALISLGSHLGKLAEIRDLAIRTDNLKVALTAEKARGEVAGFYKDNSGPKSPGDGPKNPAVVLNLSAGTPVTVKEWSSAHGSGAVIEVGK